MCYKGWIVFSVLGLSGYKQGCNGELNGDIAVYLPEIVEGILSPAHVKL